MVKQARSIEARSGTERELELWNCPKRSEGYHERGVASLSSVTMHKLQDLSELALPAVFEDYLK